MYNNEENNLYHDAYRKPEEQQPPVEPQRPSVDDQLRNYQNTYQYASPNQPAGGWQNGPMNRPNEQNYYQSGYAGYASPVQPPMPGKPPKKKHTALKMVALALVCALLGGAAGAGITLAMGEMKEKEEDSATVNVSSRPVADVILHSVDGQKLLTDAENYAANVNSAVSINCSATTNYFGQTVENASSGSGFILTEDGYIVTNHHVIEGATKVTVTMYNGETYDATIIGSDEDYDIGVIKVEATGLPAVTIGNSEKLNVGDRVLAIGNPLGELTFSQTGGMVSSVNRAINVDGTPFNMIQTDTSINPGNSGGPLFNSYGEVVGIVTAKYSTYSDSVVEGLGFAIPINDVMAMIEDIMTNGYVTNKPYLGISAGTLTEQMAAQYRYSISDGVFIYSVDKNGAADKAGLKMGDVIRKVDEHVITSLEDLTAVKKKYAAGDTVTLTVYRAGEEITLKLTWDVQPEQETAPAETPSQGNQGGQGGQGGNQNPGRYPDNYSDIFDMLEEFFGQYGGFGGFGGFGG